MLKHYLVDDASKHFLDSFLLESMPAPTHHGVSLFGRGNLTVTQAEKSIQIILDIRNKSGLNNEDLEKEIKFSRRLMETKPEPEKIPEGLFGVSLIF
mgnify:CR=1 FL=1